MANKNKNCRVIPLRTSKPGLLDRIARKEGILEEGKIGNLDIKVLKRGSIHISDGMGGLFKKDPELFEDDIINLDHRNLKVGDEKVLKGNGDNDDLVVKFVGGTKGYELSINKKEFGVLTKLRTFLSKGKKAKQKNG